MLLVSLLFVRYRVKFGESLLAYLTTLRWKEYTPKTMIGQGCTTIFFFTVFYGMSHSMILCSDLEAKTMKQRKYKGKSFGFFNVHVHDGWLMAGSVSDVQWVVVQPAGCAQLRCHSPPLRRAWCPTGRNKGV